MKEIDELNLPRDRYYTKSHEWARRDQAVIRIGISDYAQDQLGDIVFVEMPEAGDRLAAGEEFGSLESVKAISAVYIPLKGEITAINQALEDSPELVNEDPYSNWLIEIRPAAMKDYETLLSRDDYLQMLRG